MEIKLKKYRIHLIVCTFVLLLIGLYMVRDSSLVWAEYLYNDSNYYFKRQLVYLIFGIGIFYLGMKINLEFLRKKSFYFLLISILLLIIVIIPGVGITKNGSTSWLGFSFLTFQPSEFFKISVILFMSHYLERIYYQSQKLSSLIPLAVLTFIGIILIMIQPDFGTCMVLSISIFVLVYLSRLKSKWFIFFIGAGILAITIMILSEPYRFERITSFIDPFKDPLGSGFQIIQSLYALGPGGLIGKMHSYQKYFYLPEPQTDFIFSIISEEFGFLGVIIVCSFFFFIFYRILKIALSSNDLFKKYLVFGLAFGIFIQAALNLAVVVGLIPVTGVTLPFFSYGGSSLLISMICIGLVLNVSREN